MATKFYGVGGNNSTGDGTIGNPFLDYDVAVTNTVAGDTVSLVNSSELLRHPTAGYLFDDDRVVGAASFRGGTLAAADAVPQSVCATSATLDEANNPFIIDGIIIDGEGSAGPDRALTLPQQSVAESVEMQLKNMELKSGAIYALFIDERAGRQDVTNMLITGELANRFIAATGSLSNKGDQVINFNGIEIQPDEITGSKKLIELSKEDAATNTLTIAFKGLTGTVPIGAGASVTVFDSQNVDSTVLSDFDLTINGDDATSVTGLLIRGRSAANHLASGEISNGNIRFNCPVGFGVAYGASTSDNFITAGKVSSVNITGKFYAAPATPHNAVMGEGTAGDLRGGFTRDGYVGWLFSINTFTASGVLAFDCYGPSFYAKGVVSGLLQDCTAVITGKTTQRERGILSSAPQGATDTASMSFNRNTVIVKDVSKIHSLAYKEDALQLATFSNNTYIIPDSVDITTELLFSRHNGAGGAANQTIAQWNANAEVTNDMIVQMPISEINKIIEGLRPSPAVGSMIKPMVQTLID